MVDNALRLDTPTVRNGRLEIGTGKQQLISLFGSKSWIGDGAARPDAPGDAICVRGGVYTNSENRPFAILSANGTAEMPIYLGEYPGEDVILQGTGTEETWNDGTFQEWSDGDRNMGFIIDGDHWYVYGFELRYLSRGIRINGDFNTVIGIYGH